MHGLMFREFLLFAEDATSEGFVEDMIKNAGATDDYDEAGPFDHEGLISMMGYLARQTGYDFPELCYDFGRRLFTRFTFLHPEIFAEQTTALDFLQGIEAHIHEQVRTLIPKSRPPLMNVTRPHSRELIMHYQSNRPFADLCGGLIEASLEHFEVKAQIRRQAIGFDKTEAVFTITTQH